MQIHCTNTKFYAILGADPEFTKGGAQYNNSEHDNCVRITHSGMWSMPNLGGLGACPPENFLKIKPSEIKSEGIFNGLLSLPLQDSTLQNN